MDRKWLMARTSDRWKKKNYSNLFRKGEVGCEFEIFI